MTSEEALYLLMANQKKVRDGFTFIDLNTQEKVSIEECYDIVINDLEVLEILKRHSTRLDDEDWNNNIFNGIDYENLDEKERKIIKEWLENELLLCKSKY